jgi:hypothetical protein
VDWIVKPGPRATSVPLRSVRAIAVLLSKAVKRLRGCGYSWAEIGSRLGITRQAAHQRWG